MVLGRRPLGAVLHSSNEPDELSQWLCHDDSTINIVLELLLLFIKEVNDGLGVSKRRNFGCQACEKTCYQRRVIEQCQCSDAYFPRSNASAFNHVIVPVCSNSNITQGASYNTEQFLPRDAMHSAHYDVVRSLFVRLSIYLSVCLSVCLFVCLSHTSILCPNGKTYP